MVSREETIVIISEIRDLIDKVDESIVWYIMLRLSLARMVMKVKAKQGIPIVDLNREEEILASVEKYVRDNYRGPTPDLETVLESIEDIVSKVISLGKSINGSQQ